MNRTVFLLLALFSYGSLGAYAPTIRDDLAIKVEMIYVSTQEVSFSILKAPPENSFSSLASRGSLREETDWASHGTMEQAYIKLTTRHGF